MRKAAVIVFLSLSLLVLLPTETSSNHGYPRSFLNSGPVGSTDYPWAMFHYDAGRNGATPASGPTSASLMWSYTTGGIVYASPVVADGFVFIPSYDGKLYALDEYTGSLIWSFTTGSNIVATPAVENGIVYLSSKDFTVYALDENSGSVIWQISNVAPVVSSPVLADGKLFYGTLYSPSAGRAEFLALNPKDGTVFWRTTLTDYIEGSGSVSNGRIFFGMGAAKPASVVALNETTGKQLWTYGTGLATTITTAPATAYGDVYIGLDSTRFLALTQATGSLVWSFNTPGGSNATTPAVHNGVVYLGTGGGIIYARNATTGSQIWRYPTAGTVGAIASSPALALGSNTLFFGSNDHYLYELNMMTGALVWRYLAGGQVSSSPAVANSRVFFGAKDAKAYALGVIIPKLQATIGASPTILRPLMVSNLTVTVRNSTGPISGANLTFTSSPLGTFSQPIMTSPGTYVANFTAPIVSSTTSDVIQVVASASGYINAAATTTVTIVQQLQATISASPTILRPLMVSNLTVTVRNSTGPISGANLTFTSSPLGTFSQPIMTSPGTYVANFTAPIVSSTISDVIQVVASASGYINAAATTVTINPFPPLTVVVAAKPGTTTPGGEVLLMIRVTNGTEMVGGASLILTSSSGGSFSGLTDSGNGNYTAIYTSPLQSSTDVVTVQASKNRFASAQGQVVVTVSGIPDLTTVKVAGLPLFLFAAAIVLIFFILITVAVTRRDRSRSHLPPQPSFTY